MSCFLLTASPRRPGASPSGQSWVIEKRLRTTPLIPLVHHAAAGLAADNRELAQAARTTGGSAPAGEWLLDNYYLIEQQLLLVHDDLPDGYGQELPRLTEGVYRDFPRLYEALLTLLEHTDSRLDEEYLRRFVDGYQEVSPLTIGEAWAVPIMLRIGLVDNLRRLSRAAVSYLRAELAADSWAERLLVATADTPEHFPSAPEPHRLPRLAECRRHSSHAWPVVWAKSSGEATRSMHGSSVVSRRRTSS